MNRVLNDQDYMSIALSYGRQNLGAVAPNPSVGALIITNVSDCASPRIVHGVTDASGKHAERIAIERAGDLARGATMFVTLEPCTHFGRTPPCADAIVHAGLRRVVCAVRDPNPLVAGKGFSYLKEHGIDLSVGVCRETAIVDHYGHMLRALKRRPLIHVKLAQTQDHYIAFKKRASRLKITSNECDVLVHQERRTYDAILVGIETVLIDNPMLTVRLGKCDRTPKRIVLDTTLRIPHQSILVQTAHQIPTWVFTSRGVENSRLEALREHGVHVCVCSTLHNGMLDLTDVMEQLHMLGLTRVYVEGGQTLIKGLLECNLVDRFTLVTSRQSHQGLNALYLTLEPKILAQLHSTPWSLVETRTLTDETIHIYDRSIQCLQELLQHSVS